MRETIGHSIGIIPTMKEETKLQRNLLELEIHLGQLLRLSLGTTLLVTQALHQNLVLQKTIRHLICG